MQINITSNDCFPQQNLSSHHPLTAVCVYPVQKWKDLNRKRFKIICYFESFPIHSQWSMHSNFAAKNCNFKTVNLKLQFFAAKFECRRPIDCTFVNIYTGYIHLVNIYIGYIHFVNIYIGYIHSAVNGSYALKFCCKKL